LLPDDGSSRSVPSRQHLLPDEHLRHHRSAGPDEDCRTAEGRRLI
jgi:hypothetical protein